MPALTHPKKIIFGAPLACAASSLTVQTINAATRSRSAHPAMIRSAIVLLALVVSTAVQAAECSPGTEARRCYLGAPAVDAITKEAEATHPPRHQRIRSNVPKCQGFGGPGCFLRVE